MSNPLDEIRAKLLKEKAQEGNSGDWEVSAFYPHWKIPDGTTAIVRFLPDKDDQNPFFWVDQALIKLTFSGVRGQSDNHVVTAQVPCVEMWGETCPVLTEVRGWFDTAKRTKDKELENLGRKYWKKHSHLFQGFVINDPLANTENYTLPDNPIRIFRITGSIFGRIKAGLLNEEIQNIPIDYENGLNFRINKSAEPGPYGANYSDSDWSRNETALTPEQREVINQFGLHDLSSFLPDKPSVEHVAAIKEMFEASVNGEEYDESRWGDFYRPWGLAKMNGAQPPASTSTNTQSDTTEQADAVSVPQDTEDQPITAESILDRLRNQNLQPSRN